jgi:HEAT repeat protein
MRLPGVRFNLRRQVGPAGTPARSRRVGVRTLMALVATCAAMFWAARIVFDTAAPVNRLAREVVDGAPDERLEAAQTLGGVSAGEAAVAVPALAAALQDDDERVVDAAARSLGQIGVTAARGDGRAAVRALAVALTDSRPGVRVAAAVALGTAAAASAPEVDALAVALGDRSVEVRSAAARALGAVGSSHTLFPPEALIAALEADPSDDVRAEAAAALGQFLTGRDAATLALLRALGADVPRVRAACDSALARLRSFRSFAKEGRTAAIVPALIEALANRERRVRYHAAAALGEIGPEAEAAVPALVAMLSEPIDPEMDATRDDPPYWDLGGEAARALGGVAPGTPAAAQVIAALTEVIRRPGLARRRATAAEALARFGPEQLGHAVPMLLGVLRETVGEIGPPAPSVCEALGRAAPGTLQADEAVAAMTAALDSKWEYTRSSAARALAGFGRRAAGALPRLRALAETDPFVRTYASAAVRSIEGEAGEPEPK